MRFFSFFALTLLAFSLDAQNTFERFDSTIVFESSDTLKLPFAGGLNAPEFSEFDLNYDGTMDLIIFDREDNKIRTFINKGSLNKTDYVHEPIYEKAFPDTLKFFVLTYDFDDDGKMDIFSYYDSGIATYKNQGSASNGIVFQEFTDSVIISDYGTQFKRIGILGTDIPAFSDVDNDGDMDILTFELQGLQMEYHQNMSVETYGNADSLIFSLADPCWGKFEENFNTNAVTLNTFCKGGGGLRHSGSSVLALDLDGDSDKDMLLGDLTFKNVTGLINGGDSLSSLIDSQDTKFPVYAGQINILFPANYYMDINNDGIKDLIAATNSTNSSPNKSSAWLYLNSGANDSANFNFIQNDFLQEEMIDLGSGARPVFFDFNADGKLDIIAGNDGYYQGNGIYNSRLAVLENKGSTTDPVFEIVDQDYLNLSSLGLRSIHPTFGDLDDDGDQDMIIGELEGFLHYFENSAGPNNPVQFSLTTANFMSIDIGRSSTPFLYDVNGDDKLDLVVGEESGNVNYFENLGTKQAPMFSASPTDNTFGDIEVMPECCTGYTVPHMTKNSQNKPMLFVGTEQGNIIVYDNIENNLSGTFTIIDTIPTNGEFISVSAGNLFNNLGNDIVYGQSTGGFAILKQKSDYNLSVQEPIHKPFSVYPTLVKNNLHINTSIHGNFSLKMIDISGRVIWTKNNIDMESVFNISDHKSGMYMLEIWEEQNIIQSLKIIKI
ncbi:MAG: T9SS type A sorting domain-containing protein [Flavobacteriales bacterium]|nr:T9SS type A sorting domain-containing protein [Flavobacteriales bacterium]